MEAKVTHKDDGRRFETIKIPPNCVVLRLGDVLDVYHVAQLMETNYRVIISRSNGKGSLFFASDGFGFKVHHKI